MSIRDENIPIGRNQDGGWLIERIRTISGDTGLAERHQDLSVGTELENLMTLSVLVRILAIGSFSVRHPYVAFTVDANTVRTDEHSRPKALHRLSRFIKFHNGRQIRSGAVLSAASVKGPNTGPVTIHGNTGRGSNLSSLGKLEPILDSLIGIMLRIGGLGQRNHRCSGRYDRSDKACIRHGNLLLKDVFQPKLNLPLRRACCVHSSGVNVARSADVEQCRGGYAKIRMIRQVEEFCAELDSL